MNRRCIQLSASLLAISSSAGAWAQSAPAASEPAATLEEVVVTAQKRTESVRDTPAAVSVIAQDQLVQSGVSTIDDLGKAVPSLVALPATATLRPFYTIRGVSTNVITVGSPSGVAVMLDGVTLAPESLAARQLSDIANVEVLRGPQSTLGGRAASIGVINIVTRSPTDTFEGNAGGTLTTDGEYRGQAFVAGPLSDKVGFSLSGFGSHARFVTRNLTTGKHDYSEGYGLRGKLRFQLTDDLTATLATNYVHAHDSGAFQAFVAADPTAMFRGTYPLSQALPGISVQSGNVDYRTIDTPSQSTDDQLHTLTLDYRVGAFTLTSLSAYTHEKRDLRYDVYSQIIDWASLLSRGAFSWNNIQRSQLDIDGFNQELRAASDDLGFGRVLAGLYYDYSKTAFQFDRPAFGTPIPFGANRIAKNNSFAAYTRVDLKIGTATTLTPGLRFARDKVSYLYNLQYNTTPASSTTQFTRTGSSTSDTVVGDLTLKHNLSELTNVYVKYSRGYKPQVYNLDATVTPTNTFNPVDKEKIDSYEGGLKGDFLDRALSFGAAVYYTRYKNFQVQAIDPAAAVPTFILSNAGQASTRGVEVDAALRTRNDFTINFAAAHVDARYDKFVGATCYSGQTAALGCITANGASSQNLSGARMPTAPEWKLTLGAEKRIRLSNALDVKLGGVLNYQSEMSFDANKNPGSTQPAYTILNLSAGIAGSQDKWSVTAFVNNATDKLYLSNITDLGGRYGNKPAFTGWYGREARRYGGVRLETKF